MTLSAPVVWQDLARADAPVIETQLGRLEPARRREVCAVLDGMAACAASTDGVKAAWKLVTDALPGLERPDFAGSGEGPNRSALRAAGTRVLAGLVARAASALTTTRGLGQLLGAIETLDTVKADVRDQLKDEARAAAQVKP